MKLDGFYKGTVGNNKSSWLGKTFFASKETGINNFKESGKIITKYPFKTYLEKDLLKLDYGSAENPWWVRRIVDELKEITPTKFEGIMKIRIIFGILLPIGRFKLEKSSIENILKDSL